jgi:heptosyltransferase-2
VDDDTKNYISDYLIKQGIKNKDCVVAIHPGAKRPSRRWPISRFIEISRWINKDNKVLITGGTDEVDLAQQISSATPGVISTSGALTLMQMAALLERCDLFVTNDTGIMHMAFALKAPTIALFGPGDVKRWIPPETERIKFIHHPLDCSPCYRWDCEDLSCMKAITVAEVKEAVLKLTQ